MARMTLASIRAELDTLARHYGCTITIERTDKDGNADAAGRYVNVIVPSGVTSTGIICNNLTDAYNTIRQYLAQAGIVPSTDTFPANNLTAAVAAHHRRFVASLNDPQPEPPATTIDIASKYGTFTYQMVAWRCADKGNGGIASYPTWHETLDAHEWLDYRPLTTDRIKRVVTTWPAQNIATVELDNGYWYQVRYETMPAPAPEPYEPGVFGGAHPGDDEETIEESAGAYLVSLVNTYGRGMVTNRGIPMLFTTIEDAVNTAHQFMQNDAAQLAYDVIEMPSNTIVASGKAPDHCPAPTPDYATIPAIGGGSHEADTQPAKKARPRVWFACPGCGKSVHTSRGITINGETWHKACHEPQPAKQRTKATSQKRDNQRAERAALNEAYHANAETHAPDIAAILTDLGFTVTEQRESGETPVTIWQSDEATIKQTPYTLRVYNGQPKRLSRHGDAEIINSVEAGWIMRTQPTGYAAGVVAAILPLIETPDPYMQALDAMESDAVNITGPVNTPEQAFALEAAGQTPRYEVEKNRGVHSDCAFRLREVWPDGYETSPLMFSYYDNSRDELQRLADRFNANRTAGESSPAYTPEEAAFVASLPPVIMPPYVVLYNYQRVVRCDCGHKAQAYTMLDNTTYCLPCADAHIATKDALPALVLHGGQPAMTGPWQAPSDALTIPAISGGSQDYTIATTEGAIIAQVEHHDISEQATPETCSQCGDVLTDAAEGNPDLCRDCDQLLTECQHTPDTRFCAECGHDAHPDAPQPTDTGTSHDVTMPSGSDPEPVVYEIEITTQDLNDAPYYTATATYHCRSQRGIEAQRRAVIKRANRAADHLNVPADSVISIHCDDADSDVRYHTWYTRKEHRLFLAMQAGDARAADAYEAEMFKRITD